MSDNTSRPWYSGRQKKYVPILAACLAISILGTAWFVSSIGYESKKKDILIAQNEALAAWVSGKTNAISLWRGNLEEQVKRVSTSELYRLFAADVSHMEGAAAVINDPDAATVSRVDGIESLSEQVPLMRNVLLDFMNYNGFTDARIVNGEGQTLLSSLTRPSPVTIEQRSVVERALSTGKIIFGPIRMSQSGLVLDFADPLTSVMGEEDTKPVAALVLTTPVSSQIAQFLTQDLHQVDGASAYIIEKNGSNLEILVQSGRPVELEPRLFPVSDTGNLSFGLRESLNGQGVAYSLGTYIPELNWWMALEMPASLVDARLRSQAWLIYGLGALAGVGILLVLALLWWVVVGREQRAIAERFEKLYIVIKRQKRLLDSINVSLDVGLLMSDPDGAIQLCNRAFAKIVNQPNETDLAGKTLTALFDTQAAARLVDQIRHVIASADTASFELEVGMDTAQRLYRVTLFPFVDSTTPDDELSPNENQSASRIGIQSGAVAIFQDITEFRRRSEQHRRQQMSTISALIRAIEGVDPYLAGHSQMMTRIAAQVSRQLGLSEKDQNTVRSAAGLSQVGKLFVPRELLTKTGGLTPEEQIELTHVPDYAFKILRDIDFGLPVPEAVYEMYERMDGTGYPRGIPGDQICIHARILAVVNAFCAMVSPRSYRAGMPVQEAIRALHTNSGSFDPRIVDTLDEVINSPEGSQCFVSKE